MNTAVSDAISSLSIGESQVKGSITVLPLLRDADMGPEYLTLGEALAQELLTVTEVSAGGSVPELKVRNEAAIPVLILDGEELRGAKQNRVVNTTILIKEKSEMPLPVSCTEQGRWRYTSDKFTDSNVVMARKARSKKSRSVSHSLRSYESYRGDQGEVWEDVEELQSQSQVHSPTGAMSDVFESRAGSLREWMAAFPVQPNQCGLALLWREQVMGLDLLSRRPAYAQLHERLLKSYLIDLMNNAEGPAAMKAADSFQAFLEKLPGLEERNFPSQGLGEDFRYESPALCGSALVYDEACIHAAYFHEERGTRQRADTDSQLRDLPSFMQRRRYHRGGGRDSE